MRRIKVCSIPEIFCIVYRQKSIESKRNFRKFLLLFGELSVKESRARGLPSILVPRFNRLLKSCPIV